jgi:hypothetical protein
MDVFWNDPLQSVVAQTYKKCANLNMPNLTIPVHYAIMYAATKYLHVSNGLRNKFVPRAIMPYNFYLLLYSSAGNSILKTKNNTILPPPPPFCL